MTFRSQPASPPDWQPDRTGPASRGAPDPSDAFAGLLDLHQARTATAEGQNRSPQTDRDDDRSPVAGDRAEERANSAWAANRRADDGVQRERPEQAKDSKSDGTRADGKPADRVDKPADDKKSDQGECSKDDKTNGQADASGQTNVAAAVALATAAPNLGPAAPSDQTVAPPASGVPTPNPAAQAQASPLAAPAAATAAASAAPVPAAEAPAAPAAAGGEAQVAEVDSPKAGEPGAATPPQQSAEAAAVHPAAGDVRPQTSATANGDLPGQPEAQQRPAAAAAAQPQAQAQQAQADSQADRPAPAPAVQPTSTPVAPASSQPAAPPGLRGGLTPATPVPLARAAETVEHVLRMASARGVTQARIALHPAELGSIDIHLRHTAEGVMARVVAHTGEATQALQQAASDLRRALEEQGVKLLGLDIGQSGDERAAGRSGGDPGAQARGGGDTAGSAAAGDATGTETSTDESIRLPNGVLVDVLA